MDISQPNNKETHHGEQKTPELSDNETIIDVTYHTLERVAAPRRSVEVLMLGHQAASLAIVEAYQQPPEEKNLEIPDNIILGEE